MLRLQLEIGQVICCSWSSPGPVCSWAQAFSTKLLPYLPASGTYNVSQMAEIRRCMDLRFSPVTALLPTAMSAQRQMPWFVQLGSISRAS